MVYTPYEYYQNLKPAEGYYYDEQRADAVLAWFERYCSLTSAKWLGEPFRFIPWQEMVLRPLYGFVDADGLRQFSTVFIFVPKKNGKTELSSGMGLFHLIADNELAPEVYVIASNVDQAKLCWQGSVTMVEQNSMLQRAKLESITNPLRIKSPMNRGIFRVLSSIARGKQGLRPSTIICDEMHEWRGREIYDALTHPNATMTREQPLTIIITTAGDNENLCNEIYSYGLAIQNGEKEDNTFLPAIWSTDLVGEQWDDINLAKRLCPGWDYTIKPKVIEKAIAKARTSELEEAKYKMWTLNAFQKKNARKWLSMPEWDKCVIDSYDDEELQRMHHLFYSGEFDVYAGLDFAPLRDLSTVSFMVRDPETQIVYLKHHSWITQLEADRQTHAMAIPFNKWGEQNYITILPDKVIEPSQIAEYVAMTLQIYTSVKSLAYDAYRIKAAVEKLEREGKFTNITVVDIPNTYRSLNEASTTLADLVLMHKIRFMDDPVLRHAANNVTCRADHTGLIKPDKSSTVDKIDPIVGGIYALDCMIREESKFKPKLIPFKPTETVRSAQQDIMEKVNRYV